MFQCHAQLSRDKGVVVSARGGVRVARASRVLVAASRRNELWLWVPSRGTWRFKTKVRDGEDAIANTRDACATDA
jgi:hypothetical protein